MKKMKNEKGKVKSEKSRERKKVYLGIILILSLLTFNFSFVSCLPKKQEVAVLQTNFSQSQKLDYTVQFNNETIPMTVYYSRAVDGEYHVIDGVIFEYDGKKHTISLGGLEEVPIDDLDNFNSIEVADYNFDDFMDIGFSLCWGRGTRHSWQEIYLYNQHNQKYYYHAELSAMPDVEINDETRTLRSIINSGHAGLLFTDSEFKWENGQLTLINRISTDYDDDLDEYLLTTRTLSNGVWNEQTQTLKGKDIIAALNGVLPAVVDLFKYDEKRAHFIGYNNWFSSRYDFRIWGWSKDGKVAYSYTEFNDGAGWETKYFYILDFIDDKFLWKNSLDDYEGKQMIYTEGEGSAEGPVIDYDELYREFMNVCKNHKIELSQAEFKKLPIMLNNKVYNVIVEQNKRNDSDEYGYDTIESYKIVVETGGKSKLINEGTFSEPTIFDVFSLGYFISPFENRALIVIGRHIRHWEGTNNDYILLGCHLDTGFN
jgi:hypothetical protein